jgi:hypothetical protein
MPWDDDGDLEKAFSFTWKDNDGDIIRFDTTEELRDAIQSMTQDNARGSMLTLKFSIILIHPKLASVKETPELSPTPAPVPQPALPINTSTNHPAPFPEKERSPGQWIRGACPPMPIAASMDSRRLSSSISSNNSTSSSSTAKPQLKAKFICDVSIADGTNLQAGEAFVKIWRVMNDGSITWPDGCKLVHASGDDFQPVVQDVYIPSAKPNEEVDIAVDMIAPSATGRHIEYFRLQTPEEAFFGVRLWVGVNVLEKSSSVATAATKTSEGLVLRGELVQRSSATASAAVTAPVATVHGRFVDDSQFDEKDRSMTTENDHDLSMSQAIWKKLYAAELATLAEIGFHDEEILIPLLREHVDAPTSQTGAASSVPSPSALQKVVMTLLGQSQRLA